MALLSHPLSIDRIRRVDRRTFVETRHSSQAEQAKGQAGRPCSVWRSSYRFTQDAALEVLLVTTRQTKRWIVPKGWPIKGLGPAKSAAREAFEEAGVRGKVGAKPMGLFAYDKLIDAEGVVVPCEVKVFPLLVTRQSESFPNRNSDSFSGPARRRPRH